MLKIFAASVIMVKLSSILYYYGKEEVLVVWFTQGNIPKTNYFLV